MTQNFSFFQKQRKFGTNLATLTDEIVQFTLPSLLESGWLQLFQLPVAKLPERYFTGENSMTRIRLIAFLICCLGGPLVKAWLTDGSSSSHVFAAEDSLKSVVAGRFDVGVGAGLRALRDPNNQDLVVRHFNYLTPENCMKFASVQPNEGEFLFQKADRMVEFAQANNLKVLGHCLVWAKDDRTPQWFYRNGDQEVSAELLMKRMKRHIKTVVERYKGRVQSWDVVNEAIGGRQDEYLRDSVWAKLLNLFVLQKKTGRIGNINI